MSTGEVILRSVLYVFTLASAFACGARWGSKKR